MSNNPPPPDYAGAEKFILQKLEEELSPVLFYHGLHHTLDVMEAAMEIADFENMGPEEICLLRIAVAFHDAGFVYTYRHHEQIGCEMAKEILPDFGFNQQQIQTICGMILATRIPQSPQTVLEQIICDADLDYLGREDASAIASTLYDEMLERGEIQDEASWNNLQIAFLRSHHYHTAFAKQFREENKKTYLDSLPGN
jgi:uncharacterized protein